MHTLHGQLNYIVKSPDRLLLRAICRQCRMHEQWQGKGRHPERLETYLDSMNAATGSVSGLLRNAE